MKIVWVKQRDGMRVVDINLGKKRLNTALLFYLFVLSLQKNRSKRAAQQRLIFLRLRGLITYL